jgi:tellurite resistance protein TehA-like permease
MSERARGLGEWWGQLPPAAGSAVMATGIVSVGLHLTGDETLSRIFLVLAAAAWLALAAHFARRLLFEHERWEREADTPAALTAVAATAVLGTRLSVLGWQGVAVLTLVIAALFWPVLLVGVVRHWGHRMPGAVFLVCVATEGLAVLGATLAAALPSGWLGWAALACSCLGLVLYVVAFPRFDLGQVYTGAGDQWVAGGALAICTLAGSKLLTVPNLKGPTLHDALRTATLVLLALCVLWYAVLVVAEIRRPRLHYDVRRWATVFPLGMTAAAMISTATAASVPWLRTPGQVLLWVVVAVWAIVLVGLVRSVTAHATHG